MIAAAGPRSGAWSSTGTYAIDDVVVAAQLGHDRHGEACDAARGRARASVFQQAAAVSHVMAGQYWLIVKLTGRTLATIRTRSAALCS